MLRRCVVLSVLSLMLMSMLMFVLVLVLLLMSHVDAFYVDPFSEKGKKKEELFDVMNS